MKSIKRNHSLFLAACLATSVLLGACEDWTEIESLDINTPSLEDKNPQLYEDYLKDLNNYQEGNHKLVMVSLDNVEDPGKQAERLIALPDSVDYISLNNPNNLSAAMLAEFDKVRAKGMKVVYTINYTEFEEVWKEMYKANPTLTEEDAVTYLNQRTEEMLALADKYNFDGIIADYTGRSLVSLKGEELAQYSNRQTNFFNLLKAWKEKSGKSLLFYGNVQYLTSDNISLTGMFDYIILKTALSSNGGDLTLKALLAVQAGIDAFGNESNPVPADRFIACVQLPKADDKDQIIGYWNSLNEAGEKTLATEGAAWWSLQASENFERKGMFIMNVQADYYNGTFASVREVIQIMNPSK